MKFKNLEMTGFKSFSEKTTVLIEKGLTGIVGPNGCGKSNIVEALRWCMGENSAKSMRGSGMEDVIFSGTSNRSSKNISEVVLLLENKDKKLLCFPNPSTGILNLILPEFTGLYKVEIYNLIGEKVFETNVSNQKTQLNLGLLQSGIYQIKVYNRNYSFNKKVEIIR